MFDFLANRLQKKVLFSSVCCCFVLAFSLDSKKDRCLWFRTLDLSTKRLQDSLLFRKNDIYLFISNKTNLCKATMISIFCFSLRNYLGKVALHRVSLLLLADISLRFTTINTFLFTSLKQPLLDCCSVKAGHSARDSVILLSIAAMLWQQTLLCFSLAKSCKRILTWTYWNIASFRLTS